MLTWISDVFRSILSLFDRVVYWFLSLLVSLFDQIASVRVFGSDTIKAFSERIFFLVAVIMVFKVSFSIIKYIINPDTFSDNERGMGKVIRNVILVLVSLVCVQPVFQFSYDLQDRILKSQIIEKVILGVKIDGNTNGVSANEQKNVKDRIPFNLLTSFIRPNAEDIKELDFDTEKMMYKCNEIGMYKEVGGVASSDYNPQFGGCLDKITNEKPAKYISSNGEIEGTTGTIYNEAQSSYNYSMLLDIINHKYSNNSDKYLFDYKFVVSTAAGIFVAIMYLNFCIDLAIRAVKFGFLQLIAPIPIISMIDPKSSKGGMMSKWVHNCIGTYLGLFIRIAVVNFAIFVINLVFSNKITITSGGEAGLFLKVVILFGAIMFAKEAPKLINELTGGKLGGDFKMNPLSRMPGGAAVGALAGGLAGLGAGAVGGGLATAGAAIGSLGQGAWSAAKGEGFKFNSDRVARAARNMGHKTANRATGMAGNTLKGLGLKNVSIPTPYSKEKDNRADYRAANKAMKLEDKAKKLYSDNTSKDENGNKVIDYENLYKNEAFRDAVIERESAKQQMVAAENELSSLQTRLQQGDTSVDAQMINNAKKAAKDTKDNYTLADNRVKERGKIYTSDYKNYQLYKQGKELSELAKAVDPNNSNPTYNATAAAQQQSTVNNNSGGLATTPSGIIIGGNSHTSISGNTGNSSNQGGNRNNLNRP